MRHFYSLIATIFMSIAIAQTNNALHFDGVDDYVSTTKSAIQGNVARSFEAWIRTRELHSRSRRWGSTGHCRHGYFRQW